MVSELLLDGFDVFKVSTDAHIYVLEFNGIYNDFNMKTAKVSIWLWCIYLSMRCVGSVAVVRNFRSSKRKCIKTAGYLLVCVCSEVTLGLHNVIK